MSTWGRYVSSGVDQTTPLEGGDHVETGVLPGPTVDLAFSVPTPVQEERTEPQGTGRGRRKSNPKGIGKGEGDSEGQSPHLLGGSLLEGDAGSLCGG